MGKGKEPNTPTTVQIDFENYERDLLKHIPQWQDLDLTLRRYFIILFICLETCFGQTIDRPAHDQNFYAAHSSTYISMYRLNTAGLNFKRKKYFTVY